MKEVKHRILLTKILFRDAFVCLYGNKRFGVLICLRRVIVYVVHMLSEGHCF